MGWCSDHGLPHSALLAWDDQDRAKLVAHLLESASRCQSCGTSDWEWQENARAYEAVGNTCMGCYVRESAQEQDDSRTPGKRFVLVPTGSRP